jgi:hypothetical protein
MALEMVLRRMKIEGVTCSTKRRKLMEAWAVYCAAPKRGEVVSYR